MTIIVAITMTTIEAIGTMTTGTTIVDKDECLPLYRARKASAFRALFCRSAV
jgi:hypothetical protein